MNKYDLEYNNLVRKALLNGNYKPNRTGIDTVSLFGTSHKIEAGDGYPLLTTKDLSGSRWESLVHEFLWYLSGEEHIRTLREHTAIWNAWANENGELDTAYGRFWRRYPAPKDEHRYQGENWAEVGDAEWVNDDGTIDQVNYVINQLKNNPNSRRMVVTAWHPANSTTSELPPCHFTYVINVQGNKINCHLTQRSGDIALGVPFNIAAYSLLTRLLANQTGYEVGEFHHTIVDAHMYCGSGPRGEWYGDNLEQVQEIFKSEGPKAAREFILESAPPEENEHEDHIPNLLKQMTRTPREQPTLSLSDSATVNSITADDITLSDYDPHSTLRFFVAE